MPEDGPRPVPTELALLEIAAPGSGLVHELAAHLSRVLPMPCRVLLAPETLALPELPGRDQLDADTLLARLEALEGPPDAVRVGVTARDIGHPIFTHFFGRARRGGRAALVSTARLDPRFQGLAPDPRLLLHRATVEVLHELGHLAGLEHCPRWDCVMRFAANVEALDTRGEGFCPGCAERMTIPLALPRLR